MTTIDTSEALLPCPFCGAPGDIVEQPDERGSFWTARCSKCECEATSWEPIKLKAVAIWNTRSDATYERGLRDAAEAMRPVLRSMISRGEAYDTIIALIPQPEEEG